MNGLIEQHIEKQLEPNKRKELKKIIKFINENNPYDEEFSFAMLVNLLIDEVVHSTKTVKETIGNWIDSKK